MFALQKRTPKKGVGLNMNLSKVLNRVYMSLRNDFILDTVEKS